MAYTKIGRPVSQRSGRYGMGTFGSARFGNTDGYVKSARPAGSSTKVARTTSSVTKVPRPSSGFISTAVLLLGALAITAATAYFVTKVEAPKENSIAKLGAASGSGLYPTSTNNFQDGDIINAGDWNAIETYLGTKNSTDTASISYKLTSATSSDPGHKHTTSSVTGTFGVAAGGTGQSSLTANNVLLGNGASAVQFVAPGTSGNVLQSNGSTWVSAQSSGGFAYNGDGSDGNVTISATTTLSRDMYYNNLTVATGTTLYTANYRVFVKDTATISGNVNANGKNGGNGGDASGTTLGAGGVATSTPAGSLPASTLSVNGGAGGASDGSGGNNGSNGNTGNNVTSTIGVSGIAAAAGGNSGSGCGGANAGASGGTAGAAGAISEVASSTPPRNPVNAINWFYFDQSSGTIKIYKGSASNGSSAGGASGGDGCAGLVRGGAGGGGGASGENGLHLVFSAKTLIISSTGSITANGGNGGDGGDGGNATAGDAGGGGGGGGGPGGNGGILILIYNSLTNNGSITVSAGSAGAVGALGTGQVNGTAGASPTAAKSGLLIQIQIQ